MAAPTETYIDPAVGATAGNDHGGAAFVDGVFANATNTLTKIGAFPAVTCQAGDKLYLDDNGSGEVTAGLYTISVRTNDDNVVLTADIRSGAPDPTDVRCDQHDGTVNLAWATVQHALDFTTRDAANGDRFNVRDTADDVLAAALDITTNYGTPTATAPWILQGYTTAAGDGGIGGISGGGAVAVIDANALDYVGIVDMHLHNCGANYIVRLDRYIWLANCEFDESTQHLVRLTLYGLVLNCHFHNGTSSGLFASVSQVYGCFFENDAVNKFTVALSALFGSTAAFNIISVDGATDGIDLDNSSVALNNSIYSNAGTGQGIIGGDSQLTILNNIVEGFSGVGGIGVGVGGDIAVYGHNKFYNNTTNESNGDIWLNLGNNDALIASPFANPGGDDFRVNASVRAAAWPTSYKGASTNQYLDVGAAQRQEIAGPALRGRNTLLRM